MGYDFLKLLSVDFKGVVKIGKIYALQFCIAILQGLANGWQPPSIIIYNFVIYIIMDG